MPPPKKTPAVSDAEWIVLETLWPHPLTGSEVVQALRDSGWKPQTIHTLLQRLVQKGAVQTDRSIRPQKFAARFTRDEFAHAESKNFLTRVFNGKLAPFLTCFLQRESLSKDEIQKLKKLLQQP